MVKLSRRTLLAGTAAALVAAPTLGKKTAAGSGWYDRAIIIDGLGAAGDPYVPEQQTRMSDRAWAEMRTSGVSAINWSVLPVGNDPNAWAEFQKQMALQESYIGANPDRLMKIGSIADLRAAKNAGRLGLIFGTQDTAMVGTTLDRLAEMKKLGIRIVQLTYNLRNLSGDGALEPADAGLSKLGHATIARIEQEKLLLDLSHGGARTIAEAIAASKRPATISHTGARSLYDHPRNVWDSAIKALADKGGVVGLYFMPFLVPASQKVTSGDLIRHIEHVVNIAGEDHVSIGTDNNLSPIELTDERRKALREWQEERARLGIAAPGESPDFIPVIEDLNRTDRFQHLAELLARRGWSERRLEKLFGGNLVRLYGEVWGG